MDSFTFQEDLPVICITATGGRDGGADAMATLRNRLPENERRQFFGIFWPGRDGGTYKAAASTFDSDGDALEGLGHFTIRNGPYNGFYIKDYKSQPGTVAKAFDLLRGEHEVDPDGYCLEWFVNDEDVKCMVPLGDDYRPFTGVNQKM